MSKNRVCCNCRHDIRQEDNTGHIHCYCEIEGKYLSYVSVMEHWCKYWARDRKWDGERRVDDDEK